MAIRLQHIRAASLALALSVPTAATAAFIEFAVGGTNVSASIQATVDAFRAALGDPNNGNAAGPLPGGRREINWDGGGATTAAPVGTPFNGFLNTRGAQFTTPGTGFLQTPLTDPALTGINPTYATTFSFFSPQRIFTPVGSNVVDIQFFIPGTTTAAGVSGFGAVFTDVDLANGASLSFFDVDGDLLYMQSVLPGTVADGSLSFLGAIAIAGEEIFRVRVTSGTTALGPNDNPAGGVDIVALDDFFYSEPAFLQVPEPSTLLLLAFAFAWFAGRPHGRRG